MFGWVTKLERAGEHATRCCRKGIWAKQDVLSFVAVCEAHDGNALHETADRVSKELAPWLEGAVDADLVFGSHEEVA